MFCRDSLIWWSNLGHFCLVLYSINGQSLFWNSPSSWLRCYLSWTSSSKAQSSLSHVLSIYLSQDLHHDWRCSLANPSPIDPICLWAGPCWPLPLNSHALSLGLCKASCLMPHFYQTDVSRRDGMSLLRLGDQRLTVRLLAHHCACSPWW